MNSRLPPSSVELVNCCPLSETCARRAWGGASVRACECVSAECGVEIGGARSGSGSSKERASPLVHGAYLDGEVAELHLLGDALDAALVLEVRRVEQVRPHQAQVLHAVSATGAVRADGRKGLGLV